MPFCRCSAEPIPLEGRVDDLGVRRAVSEIFAGLWILKGLVTQGIVMFFYVDFDHVSHPKNGRYVLVNRTIGKLEFMVDVSIFRWGFKPTLQVNIKLGVLLWIWPHSDNVVLQETTVEPSPVVMKNPITPIFWIHFMTILVSPVGDGEHPFSCG